MTGNPEKYVERGIIPRTIQTIFEELQVTRDWQYTVSMWLRTAMYTLDS